MAEDGKRAKVRKRTRLFVKYGAPRITSSGLVLDISEEGMRIRGASAYPVGTAVQVFLDISPTETLKLIGEVRWVRSENDEEKGVKEREMGVMLVQRGEEYKEFMKKQRIEDNRRKAKRVKKQMGVVVEFYEDQAEGVTENISEGGIGIRSGSWIPSGERIKLNLMVPGSPRALSVEGDVVHSEEIRVDENTPFYIGIQFLEAHKKGGSQLEEYVKELKALYGEK